MTTSHLSTKNLQEKRRKYVSSAVSNGNLNIASHASGSTIIDKVGNEWIDFAGAIGVLNIGHTHPILTRIVKEHDYKTLHTGVKVVMYARYINLGEKLCQVTPVNFDNQAILIDSGGEKIEYVIKMTRKYTK